MSYQGGPPPSNGYWPGYDPPNPNAYTMQDPRFGARPQYQAPAPAPNPTNHAQPPYWNQNTQHQYANSNTVAYANNGFYPPVATAPAPPRQQNLQPQFISPAQLLQQQPPTQHIQPQQLSNGQKLASSSTSARMAPANPAGSQVDMPMMLISLAEEYFGAARELAPSVALLMTAANVDEYERLIATGLGCLDAALKRVKLPPRVEAKIRLRYAGVLLEETENSMEAETTLSKGIVLCERNHYYDLKYAMQFLQAQSMSQKNPKASLKALDGHVSEAQDYEHFSWVYAFRFLRASHSLQSGNLMDNHAAVQNLRDIASLANQQADHAIHLAASLMEALAHMKSTGPEAVQNIYRAMAAARSNQLTVGSKIPQLVGLAHILDVACSIRQGNPQDMMNKLKEMQTMMDEALNDLTWSISSDTIAIPINRTPKSSQTVSQDTRMILGIGEDGRDNLMMSFLSKKDAYSITYLLCGMVLLQKNSSDQKGIKYLEAGLTSLQVDTRASKVSSGLLPELVSKHQWRGEVLCYFRLYMAFCMAAVADWPGVKRYVDELKSTAKTFEIPLAGPLGLLTTYLTGVYHQGIGDFDTALRIYENEKFNLTSPKSSHVSSVDQVERDVALLAALNSLLILQDARRQDPNNNAALLAKLEPFCSKHPNKDIETAYNLVVATVNTNPPSPMYKIKNYLRAALSGAQTTANTQFLCITLNVMCSRFFNNVVGEQAEKSAMAASVQAQKSGNLLWRSVGDGMLAQCYEVQGKKAEAREAWERARLFSQKALPGS